MPDIDRIVNTYTDGTRVTSFRPRTGGLLSGEHGVMFGVNIHDDGKVTLHAGGRGGFSLCAQLGALDARRLGLALIEAAAEVPA